MNAINEPCLFPFFRHVDESGISGTDRVLYASKLIMRSECVAE